MPHSHPLTVSQQLLTRNNGSIHCLKCKRDVKIGEKVVRRSKSARKSGGKYHRGDKKRLYAYYCIDCWKKMFY